MKIINSASLIKNLFINNQFNFKQWEIYINDLIPNSKKIFIDDMQQALNTGKVTFEKDFLPVLNNATPDNTLFQTTVKSFDDITKNLEQNIVNKFGKTINVNIVLYLGLCNGAGWVIDINEKTYILLGIEKIIEKRSGNSVLGFDSEIVLKSELQNDTIMSKVIPQDLVKFGLIPELVGRLPVLTALQSLNEEALIRILKEPKNAIVKQYQGLFSIDGVELEFTDDALREVAKEALEKKTGARGLRSIMEKVLLPVMFTSPSDPSIEKITVTKECVTDSEIPLIQKNPARLAPKTASKPTIA